MSRQAKLAMIKKNLDEVLEELRKIKEDLPAESIQPRENLMKYFTEVPSKNKKRLFEREWS